MSDELDELMLDLLNHTDDEGTWEAKVYGVLEALRERLPRGGSRASGPVLSDEMTCRECGGTGTVPQAERLFPSGASDGGPWAVPPPGSSEGVSTDDTPPRPASPEEPAPGGGEARCVLENLRYEAAAGLTGYAKATIEELNAVSAALAAKDEELRKLREQVEDADEALAACRAEAGGRIETLTAKRDEFEQVASDRLRIIHRLLDEKRSMKASWDDACEQDEVENERKDARIEALTRERDRLRAADGEATSLLRELDAAKAERDAARDEAMRMREALENYGGHKSDCRLRHPASITDPIPDCDCGWDDALTPAPGKGVDRE